MRFIHTADWHLGRFFHGDTLTEDQRYILMQEFLPLVKDEKVQAVIIAGDIYDRAVPPVEAVELFDEVLASLVNMQVKVIYIAGNHDSAKRIGFGSRPLQEAGIFVRGELGSKLGPIVLDDEYGSLYVQLYPYVEPLAVRYALKIEEQLSFDEANRALLEFGKTKLPKGRSIAVAHAFVAGVLAAGSERSFTVGGASAVAPKAYSDFCYTALGHIHNSQRAGSEICRYSGSLLKYSFDEEQQTKGVNIVELDGKGRVTQRFQELKPLHDVRRVKGAFADILAGKVDYPKGDDYIEVILTDRGQVLDASRRLTELYPNLRNLRREYAFKNTILDNDDKNGQELLEKPLGELFANFYEKMSGSELSQEGRAFVEECLRKVRAQELEGVTLCDQ